jgi:hypothetical protein
MPWTLLQFKLATKILVIGTDMVNDALLKRLEKNKALL